MSNKLTQATALDQEKVKSGIEIEFMTDEQSFRLTITVGGEHNNAQQKYAETVLRPYHKAGKTMNMLPPEKQKALRADFLSKFVILGWNEEDFGTPFSVETAKDILIKAPEFAAFVGEQSVTYSLFRKSATEEMAGN